jgi:hypothetical protein
LLLLFSSSTTPHTQLKTYTQRPKKENKTKRAKRWQKPQIKTPKKIYEWEKGGERGMKGKAGGRG